MNIQRKPWAFVTDLFFALAALVNANILGYGNIALIVCWTALLILRSADYWAVKQQAQTWFRICQKITIIIFVLIASSLGAAEICNGTAIDCHRIVSPVTLDVIVTIAFVVTLISIFQLSHPIRSYLRLRNKVFMRVGACSHAVKRGMSPELARAYSDSLYPLTPEDTLHEERLRQRQFAKQQRARAR